MNLRNFAWAALAALPSAALGQVVPHRYEMPRVPSLVEIRSDATLPITRDGPTMEPRNEHPEEERDEAPTDTIIQVVRDQTFEHFTEVEAPPTSFRDLFRIAIEKLVGISLGPADAFSKIVLSERYGGTRADDEPLNPDYHGSGPQSLGPAGDDMDDDLGTPVEDEDIRSSAGSGQSATGGSGATGSDDDGDDGDDGGLDPDA